MRKQYDEKLSENQIAKLLSNKHFICDTDLSSNHFRHSRNRLHKKNLSLKGSACDQTNSNEESFQVKEETLKEANLKIESLFTTRSFSIQIMPCYKHQIQKRQEKSTNSNKQQQKSTTDSEDKEKELSVSQMQQTSRPKKPVRQPKIKPNYNTKSGGSFMKNLAIQKQTVQATPKQLGMVNSLQVCSRYMQPSRTQLNLFSPRNIAIIGLKKLQDLAKAPQLVSIKEQLSSEQTQHKSSNDKSNKSKQKSARS